MRQVGSLVRGFGFHLVVVLAAIAGAVEVVLQDEEGEGSRLSVWIATPAVALLMLALLGRRRFPFAAPGIVWLLAVGLSFADGRLVSSTLAGMVAGLVATFLFGSLRDAVQARVGLAIGLGGAAIVVYHNPDHPAGSFVFTTVLFGIAWLAGFALRERASQAEAAEERAAEAERERESAARIAVAEERSRIARELHDVVAHAVSVMVLQAGAVRHRLPEALAEDRDALRGVEQTGRTALTEMRHLLGAMRGDGDAVELTPQPGLDRLDALVEEVGRAGLPVRLHVEGDAVSLPRAIDLSAYRIVQEGLTNALKHARASRADVTLRYGPGDLRIEILDDGAGGPGNGAPGHGLLGIRERVKIYGGEMSAGAVPDGGFALRARLPLGGH